MPFAFLFVGVVFVIAAVRNQSAALLALMKGDLTGQGSYVYWMASIALLGAIGYIRPLQPVSRAALVLVLLVLVLKTGNPNGQGGGLFTEFQTAIKGA